MAETASGSLPFWDQCVQELRVRHSCFRIRRHPGSPFIYVREMVAGRKVGEFSLKPKRCCNRDDIEQARDLCIQAHRQGTWPSPQAAEPLASGAGWFELAEACITDIKLRICKEGSRSHAINDLRKRIAQFQGPVDAKRLQSWVLKHDPRLQLKSFNRRIETLSQIHRSGQMDLSADLIDIRLLIAATLEQARLAQLLSPDLSHIDLLDRTAAAISTLLPRLPDAVLEYAINEAAQLLMQPRPDLPDQRLLRTKLVGLERSIAWRPWSGSSA